MSSHSLYAVLGVAESATPAEIRTAYKRMALKFHPDKNSDPGAEERFKEIAQAYEVLSDEGKRAHYDTYGDAGEATASPAGDGGHYQRRSSPHHRSPFGPDMTYMRADQIFREFFGGRSPFESMFQDVFGFGGDFGGGDRHRAGHGGDGGRRSSRGDRGERGGAVAPFGGGMFGGGMFGGGMFGGSMFSGFGEDVFSSGLRGAPSGTAVYTSSSTFIQNGRKITKTTTTKRFPDGREETHTDENVTDLREERAPRLRESHGSSHRLGYR